MALTREAAARKARQVLGVDVTPYPHPELEGEPVCGGFAFDGGDRAAVIGFRGGYQTTMIGAGGETLESLIMGWLAEQRHIYADAQHACPTCARVVAPDPRDVSAVCTICAASVTDLAGRPITAFAEGFGADLMVFYADTPTAPGTELAIDVMESGRCKVGDTVCTITAHHLGGVLITPSQDFGVSVPKPVS